LPEEFLKPLGMSMNKLAEELHVPANQITLMVEGDRSITGETAKVGDYFQHRQRWWLGLHEKGGKRHEVPCHPSLEEFLNAWVAAAGIGRDKKGPLFRSMSKGDKLSDNPMTRFDVLHMIKRRAQAAGLPYSTCCHTFRATGITTYLENGGTLEHAQTIANHESPRTTKLYDRTREELSFD
jgi:addiction module HigA family antidote